MQVWVGLTTSDLTGLEHSPGLSFRAQSGTMQVCQGGRVLFDTASLRVHSADQVLSAEGKKVSLREPVILKTAGRTSGFYIDNLKRAGIKGAPFYRGDIRIAKSGNKVRVSLFLDLDSYLSGVLAAEMPASYHIEALKGQALCARTYALHPRLPHDLDKVNVCDSFLCCQYFAGHSASLDARIDKAINATASEVLVFDDKPILALFSSNAGGHTENYENCFSDPLTGAFPPPPLPYLKGVAEGRFAVAAGGEDFLRYLWANRQNKTFSADTWSAKFHFLHSFSSESLEAHMHHVAEKLAGDRESAPFVVPASSGFGRILGLRVLKRGLSGVAIELAVDTDKGNWIFKKELVIRKLFENADLKLKRLNSARIFVDQDFQAAPRGAKVKTLRSLTVYGLGYGHGVGFQQQGAQGHALKGLDYRAILSHYFNGVNIEKV